MEETPVYTLNTPVVAEPAYSLAQFVQTVQNTGGEQTGHLDRLEKLARLLGCSVPPGPTSYQTTEANGGLLGGAKVAGLQLQSQNHRLETLIDLMSLHLTGNL